MAGANFKYEIELDDEQLRAALNKLIQRGGNMFPARAGMNR